jgi:acyl-CoA dehydrogenase
MISPSWRRDRLTKPIFGIAKKALPSMSDTEREALEAGDTWWDADLFTGNPDWNHLLAIPQAKLTAEEQAFLDGPVEQLCAMCDEWKISWELKDLPPEVWDFIKKNRFWGMIIPKEYGGLGFSAFAHSEVIRKLSSRSITAAVTVMVPNSLGPGELLMRFGTEEQRKHWLPRLADGREIPCFGLTSPEAGSDAAAMIDKGIVCRAPGGGNEVGIRLNWHKRYITLGPIATVLGLAFKLEDPDHILGDKEHLGITLALVPTKTKGVEIGHRHLPAMQVFENGPNWGRDVFLPIDHIIGGAERAGQGWKMLMSALAAGRGISLPSQSSAGTAYTARVSGAYARIRQQFNIPIGKFEGIQEALARLAANAYLVDGARRFTCAGLDLGHHPAVVSGIMKLHATERMRASVTDAMDIHGGKGIIDGPHNYLGSLYRSVPIGITVEGANILTRNLIVFGQGAIRSHPYILKEMTALQEPDQAKALDEFDKVFWAHVGHAFATLFRAWVRNWTGGLFAPAPDAGSATKFYRQLSRHASSFALLTDFALLTMGGALKRKEMISARLGDILSELYLLSGTLKRWQDEGRQESDYPLLAYCVADGLKTIQRRIQEVLLNFPNRPVAWFLKFIIQPLGITQHGPRDRLSQQCAEILLEPSAARDRLTAGLYLADDGSGLARLERAFKLVTSTEPIVKKMHDAKMRDWKAAQQKGIITDAEAKQMETAAAAVSDAVEVDDFAPEDLMPASSLKTRGGMREERAAKAS